MAREFILPPDQVMKIMAKAATEEVAEAVAVQADEFASQLEGSPISGSEALRAFARAIRSTNRRIFPATGLPS